MDSLTVPEFEEYLKRRHREKKVESAYKVLKAHLLGFFYKLRFKKRLKKRNENAIVIQRWFRANWKHFSGSLKKKRLEAVKVVEAHFRSYQIFMKNRDFLYKLKLRRNFHFFNELRDQLLSKSQIVIRKHWLRIRENIRKRREAERDNVRRTLRKFTVTIYLKAKRNLELINHFRKFRRTPCYRSWSCRTLKKGDGNKDDRRKRSIRRKMRDFPNRNYFKFNEELRYSMDIYEAEKKFRGKNFKRSKSEKTIRYKYRLDYRSTFLFLPGLKDLLREVKVIQEKEDKQNGNC